MRKARKGQWPGVARILEDAKGWLENGEAIPAPEAEFLAGALGRLERPGMARFASSVARLLRKQEVITEPGASDLADYFGWVAHELRDATRRKAAYLEEHPPKSSSAVFATVPKMLEFIRIDDASKVAFGLKAATGKAGRPAGEKPTARFFDVYDLLLGYGLKASHAQALLALRLNITERTVQRKLAKRPKRPKRVVVNEAGEEEALEEILPFEPYLKARLAVAARRHQKQCGIPEESFQQVARDFGLSVQTSAAAFDGSVIVEDAVKLCDENRDGWALIPLAVAEREETRLPPQVGYLPQLPSDRIDGDAARDREEGAADSHRLAPWPIPQRLASERALAAQMGEDVSAVISAARPTDESMPQHDPVQAVAEELRIDPDLVMDACRERFADSTLKALLSSQEGDSTS
ncbi:MAG: hypothetical protein K0U98_06565 [Deltaproteobacteria bacterium]|nr:hypothetical protein [Deltaproteobacteria bacterium]